ncbi:MAG: ribosome silencing factor [Rhizobacter sp.]|nr:ribosome silencing factor [Burkholderiales bacterium]
MWNQEKKLRPNKIETAAIAALEDIKATNITLLDTRPLTALYDAIIVATAESARQTKALARHVRDKVREAGGQVMSIEGEQTGEWVLVDCTELVVHIMLPTTRALYNLEELWTAPMQPKRLKPSTAVAETTAPVVVGRASRGKPAPITKTAERKAAKASKALVAAAAAETPVVKAPAVKKTAAKAAVKAVAPVAPLVEKAVAKVAAPKAAAKPAAKAAPAAKVPATKTAAVKTPTAKPAAKAPAVKAVATKKPAAKAAVKPAAKAPAVKKPAAKAPVAKPATKAPAIKAPAAKMKPIKRPAAKAKAR